MRVSIALAMVMLLSACNAGSSRFLADRGAAPTSTTPTAEQMPPNGAEADQGSGIETNPGLQEFAGSRQTNAGTTTPSDGSTTPTRVGNVPATTTTTTVAVVTIDPQEVENALAELDELMGSLGSAISSMNQAFEQGE